MSDRVRHRPLEGRDGDDARRHPARDRRVPARSRRRARRRAASRRSSASRRTTRPSGATPRSPTSSSRAATPSCCRTCATATAREGTKEYFHSVTPHTGEDGYDTIEWIAAQPWSNGRTGMVGSSYAAITQIRTALERPPHLTAIWPDVDADEHVLQPDARGRRDAAAHVLGALHPRRRRAGRDGRLGEAGGGLGRPAQPAAAVLGLPVAQGRAGAAPRPGARRDARELHDARRLRRVVGEEGERLHALLARARRHPGHDDDRLVRRLPARRHRVLRARWRRRTTRRSG